MNKAGRPAKFDRDAAVEQALQAFWRDGYQSSSVKALSELLGITRSSFYNAFESQEALYLEALDRYLARSPDDELACDPGSIGVRRHISNVVRTICSTLERDREARGCLAVNSVNTLCGSDSALSDAITARMLDRLDRIELLLQQGVERGELPVETDIAATALALKSLIVGLNTMSRVVPDKSALWPAAKQALAGLGLLAQDS